MSGVKRRHEREGIALQVSEEISERIERSVIKDDVGEN